MNLINLRNVRKSIIGCCQGLVFWFANYDDKSISWSGEFVKGRLRDFFILVYNFWKDAKFFQESLFTRNFLIFLKKVIVRIRTIPRLDIRELTQKPSISLSLQYLLETIVNFSVLSQLFHSIYSYLIFTISFLHIFSSSYICNPKFPHAHM